MECCMYVFVCYLKTQKRSSMNGIHVLSCFLSFFCIADCCSFFLLALFFYIIVLTSIVKNHILGQYTGNKRKEVIELFRSSSKENDVDCLFPFIFMRSLKIEKDMMVFGQMQWIMQSRPSDVSLIKRHRWFICLFIEKAVCSWLAVSSLSIRWKS